MDIHVNRSDLGAVKLVDSAPAPLAEGQARLRIEAFGLSANNITYTLMGDAMRYWDAFPAPEGWGRVPVWGFASVTESRHPDIEPGARVFGFLPMSEELVVTPGRINERGFADVAEHRSRLAGAYNRYQRVGPPDREADARRMLLSPLFTTSFLADDFLADAGWFGADTLVISSASAKTALGIAWCAHRRGGIRTVALTAAANIAFVEARGVYDTVAAYGDEADLPGTRAIYVDVSGSAAVRTAVHDRYRDDLVHDMILGATHVDELGRSAADLPGARPTMFFAPDRITTRSREWGTDGFEARVDADWSEFAPWAGAAIALEYANGPDAVTAAYRALFENRADPAVGLILSMHPA